MKITIKLAVAALSAAALLAPSSALAGKSHLLKLYKVEQHVDVEGQDDKYTVACAGDDLALDGMWRVDTVEQDNDYIYEGPGGSWSTFPYDPPDHADWDVLRSVRPVKVARSGNSSYEFRFTPEAGGDVSMKLWVTCLGEKAQPVGTHTHSWQLVYPNGTINADGHTQKALDDTTPDYLTPATSTSDNGACKPGFIVVQPSFEVTKGDADLVASYPDANGTQWQWKFANATSDFEATVKWFCMELRSQPASSGPTHRHRIVRNMAKTYAPLDAKFKKTGTSEVQKVCGEHYKGMIGGWDFSGKFGSLHYLGMDPRIKSRSFKAVSRYGTDEAGVLHLVCFKDKTT